MTTAASRLLVRRPNELEKSRCGDLSTVRLEQAFEDPGCPICRLVLDQERKWLWFLLWENVNDPGIREQIAASWGFCPHHAWALVELERQSWGEHVGTGTIYQDLLGRLLRLLDPPRHARRTSRWLVRLAAVAPGSSCPACVADRQTAERQTAWLAQYGREPWFARRYQAGDGLCRRHLQRALHVANAPVRAMLLEVALDRLQRLRPGVVAAANSASEPDSDAVPRSLEFLGGLHSASRDNPEQTTVASATQPSSAPDGRACPACANAEAAEASALAQVLRGQGTEGAGASLLCPTHVWRLCAAAVAADDSRALARWCLDVLDRCLKDISTQLRDERGTRGERSPWWRRIREQGKPRTQSIFSCVVCMAVTAAGRDRAAAAAEALLHDVGDAGPAADLCLIHLQATIPTIPALLATPLWGQRIPRLRILAQELTAYLHKCHWTYRDEPKGTEQRAWQRVVAFFAGEEGAVLP